HLAALESLEEDRAVEDDVLGQRFAQEVEILVLGGAAGGVRLRHCGQPTPSAILRRMPSDGFIAKFSKTIGARGLRWIGKLNVPAYKLSGGGGGGGGGGEPGAPSSAP